MYEPLVLNCELLFALIDKVDVSATEKVKIKSILDTTGQKVFLSATLISRYSFTDNKISVEASFDKADLVIPVSCLSANSVIQVTVTDGDDRWLTYAFEEWWALEKEICEMITSSMRKTNLSGETNYDLDQKGLYYLVKPFMEKNGYRDGSGWWIAEND